MIDNTFPYFFSITAYNTYLKAKKLINSHSGNKKEGYKLLFQAAELGSPDAKLFLAWAKLFGNTWIGQDISDANETFHELATTGNPDAQMVKYMANGKIHHIIANYLRK